MAGIDLDYEAQARSLAERLDAIVPADDETAKIVLIILRGRRDLPKLFP